MELPRRVADQVGEFSGRTWLLDIVWSWFEKPASQILLLTGTPGSGKSMVAAWLAGAGRIPDDPVARSVLEHIRSVVAAIHFCVSDTGSVAPRNFALTMAEQMMQTVSGFADALSASLHDQVHISVNQSLGHVKDSTVTGVQIEQLILNDINEQASFDRVFRQPLKRILSAGTAGEKASFLLIVDALDEAATYGGTANLVPLLAGLSELPANIRLLMTTRSDPRVMKFFPGVQVVDLVNGMPHGRDDVRDYVKARLKWQNNARIQIEDHISSVAGGNFLYARLVVADILKRPVDMSAASLRRLPKNLKEIYQEFLNRELGADETRWYEIFRPLIGVVAAAQGPGLTRTQIQAICGLSDIERPLRMLKQFLDGDLPNGPFRLFHQSFVDFILEDADNVDYHIDGPSMHRNVAEFYWNSRRDGWQMVDEYGMNHLAIHLQKCGDTARLLTLIDRDWMQTRFQQCGYTFTGFFADRDTAWQCAVGVPRIDIPALARLQTVAQVVREQASGYDLKDLEVLVWLGRDSEALAHARLWPEPEKRSKGLLTIFKNLNERGQFDADLVSELGSEGNYDLIIALAEMNRGEDALRILREHAGRDVDDLRARFGFVSALCEIGKILDRHKSPWANDAFTEALSVALSMQDLRDIALYDVVSALAECARFDELQKAVSNMEWSVRQLVEHQLPLALARAGQFEQVLSFSSTTSKSDLTSVFVELVAALLRASDNRADTLVDKTLAEVIAVTAPEPRAKLLLTLATALVDASDARSIPALDQFLRAAADVPVGSINVRASEKLKGDAARLLGKSGRSTDAIQVATKIESEDLRSEALYAVAKVLAQQREFNHAKKAASLVPEPVDRVRCLCMLAMMSPGNVRHQFLEEAEKTSSTIPQSWAKADALREYARALARIGDSRAEEAFNQSRKVAPILKHHGTQQWALCELTGALAQAGHQDLARKLAGEIDSEDSRSKALAPTASTEIERQERESHLWIDSRKAHVMLSEKGQYEEAALLVASFPGLIDQVEGFSEIAVIAHNAGNSWEVSSLDQAQTAATAIKNKNQGGAAVCTVVKAMAQVGQLERGRELAAGIFLDSWRNDALRAVRSGFLKAGRFDDALALQIDEIDRVQAFVYARASRFPEALESLGKMNLDDMFGALALWAPILEAKQNGLFLATMREVAGVAGWIRADWQRIHKLLSTHCP